MKAKVFSLMKPKVKDLGFTDDELMTVCEGIANGLASIENVSDEDINSRIDSMIPALKLSQSASNRTFAKMKKQFEEDQKLKKEQDEAARKKAEEEEAAKKASKKDEIPEWFKKYQEDADKKIAEQNELITAMKQEKANESFLAEAKKGLEKVDPNFYGLLLKNKKFENSEQVADFVKEVSDGWEALKKARNIQEIAGITAPGSKKEATQASDMVKARIEARKAAESNATNTCVKGLPTTAK